MSLRPNGSGLEDQAQIRVSEWNVPRLQLRHLGSEILGPRGLVPAAARISQSTQTPATKSSILDMFIKTCERWHLSLEQQIILLGYKGSEFFGQQLLEGRILAPPQDARERAGYILAISIGLAALFDESEQAEIAWLIAPRATLDGQSALGYMLEGRMANIMDIAAMVDRERGM